MSTRAERQRWVNIITLPKPHPNEQGGVAGNREHEKVYAVLAAFAKVRRVVRAEPSQFVEGIVFTARRT